MRVDGRRAKEVGAAKEWNRMPAYNYSSRYALNGNKVPSIVDNVDNVPSQLPWDETVNQSTLVLSVCVICVVFWTSDTL